MPQNKNQHYVPRAHFKPFSLNTAGDAIHVYNIKRDLIIENAPIKGQCAKNYFYGKDLVIENFLQKLEGEYASAIRRLVAENCLSEADFIFLRKFAFLQSLRTEAAFRRYRASLASMTNSVFQKFGAPQQEASDQEIVASSMKMFIESYETIGDLKSCLLINHTSDRFITSDDPVVHTNRLHLQRLRDRNFGWQNAGAMLLMPLTPIHSLMYYDGQAYAVSSKNGSIVGIDKGSDIAAMNELQALHSHSNIYFSKLSDKDRLQNICKEIENLRITERHKIRIFIHDRIEKGREYYRIANDIELEGEGPFMLQLSPIFPMPRRWPSFIRFRDPPKMFSNGSAAGFVRKSAWLERSQ